MIRVERRLEQPLWLSVAVPFASVGVAFLVMAAVLARSRATIRSTRTGASSTRPSSAALPGPTTLHLGDAAPLHRPGRGCRLPHAALQHRRRGPALPRRDLRRRRRDLARPAPRHRLDDRVHVRLRGGRRRALGLIAGVLKAFARTNEIITSLMLNYVAGQLLTYLIFDSASPWRDVSTAAGALVPAGDPARRRASSGRPGRSSASSSRSASCSRSASPSGSRSCSARRASASR